jgi:hypothetical protein
MSPRALRRGREMRAAGAVTSQQGTHLCTNTSTAHCEGTQISFIELQRGTKARGSLRARLGAARVRVHGCRAACADDSNAGAAAQSLPSGFPMQLLCNAASCCT